MTSIVSIDEVRIGLSYDEGWLPLDPPPGEIGPLLDDWLRAVAPDVDEERRTLSREALTSVRLAMDNLWIVRRATFLPDPLGAPLMTFEVRLYPWGERDPASVHELGDAMREVANPVGEPDVSVVELPSGPAVRCHWMWSDTTDGSVDGATVFEGVRQAVLPSWLDGFVMVEGSWLELAYGEDLTQRVDAMVRAMTVSPRAGDQGVGER